MDKIVITGQTLQQDNLYKISYKVTFANNTYATGHIFLNQEKLEEMGMRDIRQAISTDLITNLGGTTE
ncbi:hypothetical protein [Enterococcus sp. DIV0876]|uniref:hypothetical protein n=1 Tax=Enterococcus sp. DIV0876 TaxID=2774633 RepID=UPI003D3009EB